jgi:hypothetical protein
MEFPICIFGLTLTGCYAQAVVYFVQGNILSVATTVFFVSFQKTKVLKKL